MLSRASWPTGNTTRTPSTLSTEKDAHVKNQDAWKAIVNAFHLGSPAQELASAKDAGIAKPRQIHPTTTRSFKVRQEAATYSTRFLQSLNLTSARGQVHHRSQSGAPWTCLIQTKPQWPQLRAITSRTSSVKIAPKFTIRHTTRQQTPRTKSLKMFTMKMMRTSHKF